jgi:hypothetical protein
MFTNQKLSPTPSEGLFLISILWGAQVACGRYDIEKVFEVVTIRISEELSTLCEMFSEIPYYLFSWLV